MKRLHLLTFLLLITLLIASFTNVKAAAQTETPKVVTVTLDGPLTPVWQQVLQRGIDLADRNQAQALIVDLNTTGGSIDLMTKLVEQMLDSKTPIVVYVTPDGAMAASAGTLLVLAGDVAAMSPTSIIGAASPVDSSGQNITSTLDTKIKEATKATARSLAADRGPEAIALVEAAIDEAKAASSKEALAAGLVDIIATDQTDLLKQLDGRTVMSGGAEIKLVTANAEIIQTPVTIVETMLELISNPNLLYILMTIGIWALLTEFSHPGAWVPGFVGVVSLAFAIYGLGLLPVNWLGIVFFVAAFVLFILDIKAPTHGALTITGTASFIVGGLVLFNSSRVPSYANASVWLIVTWGLILGAAFFGIVMLAVRALKRPIATGAESMIGREGYAAEKLDPTGIVKIGGEQWSARLAKGSQPIGKDDRVIVTEVQGVKMVVKKK
jgi:membrane-bound serine protease (ClpP class)